MKKELTLLYASGMNVNDVGKVLKTNPRTLLLILAPLSENVLASTDVKGFPIVVSKSSKALAGFIGRTELRYVLGIFHTYTNLLYILILFQTRPAICHRKRRAHLSGRYPIRKTSSCQG